MAVSSVTYSRLTAYQAPPRVVAATPDEVEGAAASSPADETLRRPAGAAPGPVPYVNTLGEVTGTTIDTTA